MTRRTPPQPEDFPALAAFLSGYLHEDFVEEYRTPDGARRAYASDATDDERRALQAEARRFNEATKDWTWGDRRAAFARLGGAWLPGTHTELSTFLEALARPVRRR